MLHCRQLLEFILEILWLRGLFRLIQLLLSFRQAADSRLNLLCPGLFDIACLQCLGPRKRRLVPFLLPIGERLLRLLEQFEYTLLTLFRLLKSGCQLAKLQVDLCNLTLIGIDVFSNFSGALDRLFQVLLLTFPQLVRVLDGLFDPGDLGTGLVESSLYLVELIGTLTLADPHFLDMSFDLALLRNQRLQRRFFVSQSGAGLIRAVVEITQPECKQLRHGLAFVFFQAFVAAGGFCLPIEMLDLIFNLFQDIVEPIEVISRAPDSICGFPATFLVF